MMDTKIIAMYLPQFHSIPENDSFWGKGFTDWVAVKKATSLFKGHQQPRVPLNENYYDLSMKENVKWQANLAKEYGIYGFGIYHYWFNNNKNLLTKPAELIRDNKDVDIHYFFAWDNANWKRSWSNVEGNDWTPLFDNVKEKKGPVILIDYILGSEDDWENHYNYVKTHFFSEKYIKVDSKPVFMIYNYDEDINKMCAYWNGLAERDGFKGIHFIMKSKDELKIPTEYNRFKYEPIHSGWRRLPLIYRINNKLRRALHLPVKLAVFDYDKIWRCLINTAREDTDNLMYHGGFVGYDDTPRRGKKGTLIVGGNADKFAKYLKELLEISQNQKKEFIFLTAWNEWGEGAYLEPDKQNGYSYLESLKKICQK